MGVTQTTGKHRNIDIAISFVADMNKYTKFSLIAMRGHYNVTGSGQVMCWQSGFPFAMDFSRGYPRYNPGETAANDILQNTGATRGTGYSWTREHTSPIRP